MTHEFRTAELRDAEVAGFNFRGYAAVFDSPWSDALTERLGYVETVARGAFRKALRTSGDVPLLWQHDRNQLLARTGSGTLTLEEDGKGLLVNADLPQTQLGEYVREMIQRGDVRGMSYGIETAREDSVFSKRNGVMHRAIANARRLLDVTLTWEPSYEATTAEMRSLRFTAATLQELTDGEVAQIGEAAADTVPTFQVNRWAGPHGRFIIDQLEGGFD